MSKDDKTLFGAIPYKFERKQLWVLMVTSQTRKRWIFPSGHLEKGEKGPQAAEREALEEAGIKGKMDSDYFIDAVIEKSGPDGIVEADIRFYTMEVTKELSDWDEKGERKRKWVPLDKAADYMDGDDFRTVLKALGKNKFVAKLKAA